MKLADVSIKRPVFATVMVGVLAVFGVWAYPKIPIDMFPRWSFPSSRSPRCTRAPIPKPSSRASWTSWKRPSAR